ncbi:MAG: GWxTD domain-containing protein [Candidatus Aminicenantaceae bacterium]
MSPEYKEFFSKVRYIITKEERKIFLDLPDSEKREFQEEFWSRRDPDLFTDENEFKEEYFQRIDEANRLFHGGRPGWLQDRGRIYILFGPPSERHTYSMQRGTKPREVWYYGNFPVIFIDHMGAGDYKLESLNLAHLMELNKAQMASQKLAKPRKKFFDFEVKTHINEENEVIVTLEINYKDIWFAGVEDRLETTIVLSVELLDKEEKIVLSETKEYPISILEDDIGKEDKIIIEYPLKLKRGTYTVNLELENKAGKEKRKKTLKIEARRTAPVTKKIR